VDDGEWENLQYEVTSGMLSMKWPLEGVISYPGKGPLVFMEEKMTDHQVEKLIWVQIKRKKITFGDMIALSNNGVDPNPEAGYEGRMKRLTPNLFTENSGSARMKKFLCFRKTFPTMIISLSRSLSMIFLGSGGTAMW
jgi:hypothetical protein